MRLFVKSNFFFSLFFLSVFLVLVSHTLKCLIFTNDELGASSSAKSTEGETPEDSDDMSFFLMIDELTRR